MKYFFKNMVLSELAGKCNIKIFVVNPRPIGHYAMMTVVCPSVCPVADPS